MQTNRTTEPVRLRTPGDIVNAVPYFFGFHPTNSVVIVGLDGTRSRVQVSLRQDLPKPEHLAECTRQLAEHVHRNGVSRAVVICYPPGDDRSHPLVAEFTGVLSSQLENRTIELVDVLCVAGGRWWSLQCADDACCPPDGTPVAEADSSALAAAMTLHGQVVLGSRDDLDRTLQPAGGVLGKAMSLALKREANALANRIKRGERADSEAESLRLLVTEVSRRLDGETALDVDEAARLIIGITAIPVRDELTTWFDGDWGDAARSLLGDLVRYAVAPFQVAPLTVLGWIAYQQGNGTLAGIAVDRALAADPDYTLAQILDRALSSGLHPDTFRASSRRLRATPEASDPECDDRAAS